MSCWLLCSINERKRKPPTLNTCEFLAQSMRCTYDKHALHLSTNVFTVLMSSPSTERTRMPIWRSTFYTGSLYCGAKCIIVSVWRERRASVDQHEAPEQRNQSTCKQQKRVAPPKIACPEYIHNLFKCYRSEPKLQRK
jgi:hypothetical protein